MVLCGLKTGLWVGPGEPTVQMPGWAILTTVWSRKLRVRVEGHWALGNLRLQASGWLGGGCSRDGLSKGVQ